jgi:hypothetical protein
MILATDNSNLQGHGFTASAIGRFFVVDDFLTPVHGKDDLEDNR